MAGTNPPQLIVFRAGESVCALPIECVIETFRPLPLRAVAGTPAFVMGVSIVRSEPVPIVSVAVLLGRAATLPFRFLIIRVGDRRVGLAVDEIRGVVTLDAEQMPGLPPLLVNNGASIDALGLADGELLLVLAAGRLLPQDALDLLEAERAA